MALLAHDDVERRLAGRPGWRLEGRAIARDFDRRDFVGSVAFVNELVPIAEEMNHHPDLTISWRTVTVSITTHSEGGLTERDFELAERVDAAAG